MPVALAQNNSPDPSTNIESEPNIALYSATFTGTKFTVQQDSNPASYASNGSGNVRTPEILQGQYPSPLCYQWGTVPSCSAVFHISNLVGTPIAQFKLNTTLSSTGLQFSYISPPEKLSGTSISVSLTEVSGQTVGGVFVPTVLPTRIDNTTLNEAWLVSFDGGNSYTHIATTSNPMYVIAGSPGSDSLTNTRINRVTTDTRTLSAANDIVQHIWTAEISSILIGMRQTHPTWGNLDPGGNGQCIDIVTLMQHAIQMTGIGTLGEIVYCYPGPQESAFYTYAPGEPYTRLCTIGHTGHTTRLGYLHGAASKVESLHYIDRGGSHDNFFEAAFHYNSILYPGGAGSATYSDDEKGVTNLMKAEIALTEWDFIDENNDWTQCDPNAIQPYTGPGPYPENTWQ